MQLYPCFSHLNLRLPNHNSVTFTVTPMPCLFFFLSFF
uniref:Uncharacterized protein n=1 Tax=Rhizophora mucronata TaxID=61149 RepID=A0A2P2QAG8_RHIMU